MARVKTAGAPKALAQLVGNVVLAALDRVKPNEWNHNVMTAFERESLRYGLQHDGWIVSQALLVWGSDEKGRKRDVIIDGEHRWTVARELGMPEGPMVFLENLPEKKARALTFKMNQKRGRGDEAKTGVLLRSIQADLNMETRSVDLGIEEKDMARYLVEAPVIVVEEEEPGGIIGNLPSGQTSHVKMVQLFFTPGDHEEFTRLSKELAVRFKTKNATDTVMEAVRRAGAASAKKSA